MIRKLLFIVVLVFFAGSGAIAQINFGPGSSFKYMKGKDASNLPANWMSTDYVTTGWLTGNLPVRYGDGSGGTLLGDMQNNYSTVFLKSTFNAQNISLLKDVFFSGNFDVFRGVFIERWLAARAGFQHAEWQFRQD